MDQLPRDVLFTIALQLDFPDLLLFCKSIPRVNELICSKDYIWIAKLNNEFPNWKDFNINKPYIKIYETILMYYNSRFADRHRRVCRMRFFINISNHGSKPLANTFKNILL